jgi:hypothetical protein
VAWNFGNELQSLDGPRGFRTDNALFEFEYYTDRPRKFHTFKCDAPGLVPADT